jgi:MYXO-CTERM domain-containing protein
MSFLNAGDRESESAEALPDACAGFSCGGNGQCIAMNMTPTCVCDQGFVAVGTTAPGASRSMRCVEPPELVPADFYAGRLPSLPSELPGGRDVELTDPLPMPVMNDGMPVEPVQPVATGFPMPRTNPNLGSAAVRADDGGCSVARGASSRVAWLWAFGAAAIAMRRRRARS